MMFIFRWITRLFATLGFILALTLLYFSYKPLKAEPNPVLDLKTVLKCSEQNISNNNSVLDEDELKKIKDLIGEDVPTDAITEITENLSKLNNSLSSKSELGITYCNLPKDSDPIKDIKTYFDSKNGEYSYGSVEDLVNGINKIPFLNLKASNLKIPSLLGRSNYCSSPINNSEFYFFALSDLKVTKNIALFTIKLTPEQSDLWYKDSLSNLIETGQYLKAKYSCNG